MLYGHDYEICAMCLSYDLSILISVDKNDTCIMHNYITGTQLKSFDI